MRMHSITFIIPCFNEAAVLPEMYRRLSALADELSRNQFEFLFINDGSKDSTADILNQLAAEDPQVKVLHFASNRGHQTALSAGMDFASGDVIVTIDADLQDPPEFFKEMLVKIIEGYDIVHAQRHHRSGETWFKLATARIFYFLLRKFSTYGFVDNCGDFRAFTRPVLETVRRFREPHKFLRGNFVILGFKQCILQYDRDRRYAGTTKYPFMKMVRFATDAILGFSTVPIKIVLWLSILLLMASFTYFGNALIQHFYFHTTLRGWTSTVISITFFGSLQLFCLAIIGAYVGRIFEQGQRRPLYWLSETQNIQFEHILKERSYIPEVLLSHEIVTSSLRKNDGKNDGKDDEQEREGL